MTTYWSGQDERFHASMKEQRNIQQDPGDDRLYWQSTRKHLRTMSDGSNSWFSESGSEGLSEGSSGKTSSDYGPSTPTFAMSPTIDQFHIGMDIESATLPTDDSATMMAQKMMPGKMPDRFANDIIDPKMLASITSFLELSYEQYASHAEVDQAHPGLQDAVDVTPDYDEADIEWTLSDDEFATISVELATAVTFFRPVTRPVCVSIEPRALREKRELFHRRPSSHHSSRSSTVQSQYSWAAASSSLGSDPLTPPGDETLHNAGQWLANKDLPRKNHTLPPISVPPRSPNRKSIHHQPSRTYHDQSSPDCAPLQMARAQIVPEASVRPSLLADIDPTELHHRMLKGSRMTKKSLSSLRDRMDTPEADRRYPDAHILGSTYAQAPPLPAMPTVVVPDRRSSRVHSKTRNKANQSQNLSQKKSQRPNRKYTVFPQNVI